MFCVPESARVTDHPILGSDARAGCNGAFVVFSPEPGWRLFIIASDGTDLESAGWEHVSVHAERLSTGGQRTPNWKEMCIIKNLFWGVEDVVMQLHPRQSQYVNHHPHTLHLWRSRTHPIPEPPSILVGPK